MTDGAETEFAKPDIHTVRGVQVILDSDLAKLYDVKTGPLNQQVKRNLAKFDDAHAFQLTEDEFDALVSQNVISRGGSGGRRAAPWVFTQRGVIMAATVLKSDRAVDATNFVIETFINARELERLKSNADPKADIKSLVEKTTERNGSLSGMVTQLLDTVIDEERNLTLEDKGMSMLLGGIENLEARLKQKPLEIVKIVQELESLRAKAQSDAIETKMKAIDEKEKQIALMAKGLLLVSKHEQYALAQDHEAWHDFLYDLAQLNRTKP